MSGVQEGRRLRQQWWIVVVIVVDFCIVIIGGVVGVVVIIVVIVIVIVVVVVGVGVGVVIVRQIIRGRGRDDDRAECGGREVEYYGERRFVRGFSMVWGRENVSHSISKLLKDRSLYSAGAVHARPAC